MLYMKSYVAFEWDANIKTSNIKVILYHLIVIDVDFT